MYDQWLLMLQAHRHLAKIRVIIYSRSVVERRVEVCHLEVGGLHSGVWAENNRYAGFLWIFESQQMRSCLCSLCMRTVASRPLSAAEICMIVSSRLCLHSSFTGLPTFGCRFLIISSRASRLLSAAFSTILLPLTPNLSIYHHIGHKLISSILHREHFRSGRI